LDYIPPDNTSDRGCVAGKEVVFFRNPWLILCGILLFAALIVVGVFAFYFTQKSNNSHIALSSIDKKVFKKIFQTETIADATPTINDNPEVPIKNTSVPLVVTVRANDSLPKVFKRLGLNNKNAVNILKLKQARALNDMHRGHKLNLLLDSAKTKVQKLTYEIDDLNTLVVTATNNGWRVKTNHIEPMSNVKYLAVTIKGSIYTTGKRVGISRKLMSQVANVLGHKVNVNKIHTGDELALVYKEYAPINGKRVRDSEIIAVELAHAGKMHYIIGFSDKHGSTDFYTPDGRNIKPSFIRYPVAHYTHIGANFSFSRFHPILRFVRPHLGVDFAARTGTPVKATSNGRVAFAGSKGGYGKTVIIKNGVYTTLYAHLSRFAKNVNSGKYVRQGEVIGYVGSSGLATGPHLHYEFRVNGVHHDPLKVKLPSGEMIAAEYRNRFFTLSKKMLSQLDLHRKENKVFAMYSNSKFE